MEGRDIGTVVFPQADLKFYIDASPEERARRRAADPAHTGSPSNIANVQSELVARDQSDSTRSVAPLAKAEDAIYIDTTSMPIEAVVERVLKIVEAKQQADDRSGSPMTPEEFRKAGYRIIDWIADYRAGIEARPVMAKTAPGEIKAMLPPSPPQQPESFDAILGDLDRVVVPGHHELAASAILRILPVERSSCRACSAITSAPASA